MVHWAKLMLYPVSCSSSEIASGLKTTPAGVAMPPAAAPKRTAKADASISRGAVPPVAVRFRACASAANLATDIAIGSMMATVPAESIKVPTAAVEMRIIRIRRFPDVATPEMLRMLTAIRRASPCFWKACPNSMTPRTNGSTRCP